MKKVSMFLLVSILVLASSAVNAQRVGDFSLIDQDGVFHQLSRYSNSDVVLFLALNSSNTVEIDALVSAYAGDQAKIFVIDPSSSRTIESSVPVLVDDTQLISKALFMARYGDVIAIDPKTFEIKFVMPGTGEAIQYTTSSYVSYNESVAPVIAENCATCHRQGGIAPFAMDSAQMVKAWSPMIREVLMTKRMPPGQIDPHVGGPFINGRTLLSSDVQNIISWIDQDGPIDGDVDLLAQLTWPETEWVLGEPDLIIELPAQTIPATGMIPYRYLSVPLTTHTTDRWIRASQYLPGDRTVLHHTLHTITAPGDQRSGNLLGAVGEEGAVSDAPQITAYVPGGSPEIAPENSGSLLKAGSKIDFQLHYTTNGKESIDVSRIGVWFYPEGYVPEKRMSGQCACIFPPDWVNIPPNDPAYHMEQRITIPKDANIYSFLPHMHFRGKSMKFTAEYPDGTSEELINIANYNYAWQLSYTPITPIFVPGGTVIRVDGVFDNSEQNPANPDHNRSVPWGQMSEDEMFFGVTNWQYINQ